MTEPQFGAWFGDHPEPGHLEYRVPTPVGAPCLLCGNPIAVDDPGEYMACSGTDGVTVSPAHLGCLLGVIAGGQP